MAQSVCASWDQFWISSISILRSWNVQNLDSKPNIFKKLSLFAHFPDLVFCILRSRNVHDLVTKPLRGISSKWPFTPSIWRKHGKCPNCSRDLVSAEQTEITQKQRQTDTQRFSDSYIYTIGPSGNYQETSGQSCKAIRGIRVVSIFWPGLGNNVSYHFVHIIFMWEICNVIQCHVVRRNQKNEMILAVTSRHAKIRDALRFHEYSRSEMGFRFGAVFF